MPTGTIVTNDALANAEVHRRSIYTKLTINTSATAGSVTITSSNPAVVPYYYTGSQPTPSDSQAAFGTLTNTSGSVIGILINDGNAKDYNSTQFTFTPDLTPSITNVTVTKCGSSSTGVTATLKNVAIDLTLTGLTLNATATTQYLGCTFEYDQF